MFTLKQDLGCPRRMTVYAIFDILDRLKSSYDQVMTGDIQAQVSVFGKECLCAFAVTESSPDTSILHITLLQPISDMTKEDEQLVLLYLMEHILLHIDYQNKLEDNELLRPFFSKLGKICIILSIAILRYLFSVFLT